MQANLIPIKSHLMTVSGPEPGRIYLDILPDGRMLVHGKEAETGEDVRDALVAFVDHVMGGIGESTAPLYRRENARQRALIERAAVLLSNGEPAAAADILAAEIKHQG